MSLLQTRLRWQKIVRSERTPQLKVAVLSTFTVNSVAPYLGTALEDAGLPADVFLGPYNQVVQECLSDESETARYAPDVLVVLPRLEDVWVRRPLPLVDDPKTYGGELIEMAEACAAAAARWGAILVFALPPVPESVPLGVGDASNPSGVHATAATVREEVRQRIAGRTGVLVADIEDAVRYVGGARAYNPPMLTVARIPFAEETFATLGQRLARLITLNQRAARKAVLVDADNTLWGGVVGEEGPAGIDLSDSGPGEAHRSFQSYLLELRRAGVLLAITSKNNEADVWEAFERREMVLKKEHFSAWKINWKPKSENIRELAGELGLAPDSFVLIDDSPVELAEVQAALPAVGLILFPSDPAGWLAAVQGSGLLDRLPPTAEDLRRAESYGQERARQEVARRASSPEEFLASLGVKVRIFAPGPSDLPRLAQMVAKTNQFNLNCRRRDAAELAALLANPGYCVRVVQAEDRFGEYGVVGAYIVEICSDHAVLDTFLLSCRAMGRGIEEAMLADAIASLPSHCNSQLFATVEEQPRNQPARDFFRKAGCAVPGERCALSRVERPRHVQELSLASR